jgi:hypothetical protein
MDQTNALKLLFNAKGKYRIKRRLSNTTNTPTKLRNLSQSNLIYITTIQFQP